MGAVAARAQEAAPTIPPVPPDITGGGIVGAGSCGRAATASMIVRQIMRRLEYPILHYNTAPASFLVWVTIMLAVAGQAQEADPKIPPVPTALTAVRIVGAASCARAATAPMIVRQTRKLARAVFL